MNATDATDDDDGWTDASSLWFWIVGGILLFLIAAVCTIVWLCPKWCIRQRLEYREREAEAARQRERDRETARMRQRDRSGNLQTPENRPLFV